MKNPGYQAPSWMVLNASNGIAPRESRTSNLVSFRPEADGRLSFMVSLDGPGPNYASLKTSKTVDATSKEVPKAERSLLAPKQNTLPKIGQEQSKNSLSWRSQRGNSLIKSPYISLQTFIPRTEQNKLFLPKQSLSKRSHRQSLAMYIHPNLPTNGPKLRTLFNAKELKLALENTRREKRHYGPLKQINATPQLKYERVFIRPDQVAGNAPSISPSMKHHRLRKMMLDSFPKPQPD